MKERFLIGLCIVLLIFAGVIMPSFFPRKAEAQGAIIIEDADYVWTNTIDYSMDLINVTENVTPRMVMEYGDFNSVLDLNKSDELDQVASLVSSRITVEYANFISDYGLQGSENLSQVATSVAPRIIVQYADFIFSTDLGPKPMEDDAPPIIENVYQQPANDNVYPDNTVAVYANVTDDISGIKQVILNYTTNNGTWFTREMEKLEGDLYNATIPRFEYCTDITYVVIAEDYANNSITSEDYGFECHYHVIPEFPTVSIIPLFIVATLLAGMAYRRKAKTSKE